MRQLPILVVMIVLILSVSAPAFALETAPTGKDFGAHHAAHAKDMTGFTDTENPGVMHTGYAGWADM